MLHYVLSLHQKSKQNTNLKTKKTMATKINAANVKILVVFNDIPELTYEVWDRYKVGYHDYDVHQYEIGLKK